VRKVLPDMLRPDDVRSVRFSQSWLRQGYDMDGVDQLLDSIAFDLETRWEVVDAGPSAATRRKRPGLYLDANRVKALLFDVRQRTSGYKREDVDQLVDRVVQTMTRLDAQLASYRFSAD
jgi:DivIVA domain-containing protein